MHQKGFSSVALIVAIVVILVIFLSIAVIAISHRSATPTIAPAQNTGQPSEKVTDMAPAVPNTQKTAIVVQHSDSSFEKFLVPNAAVEGYIKSLPEGDKVVSKTSPAN